MKETFRIYSTDIVATLNPDEAAPLPATNIVFTQDPTHGEYNEAQADSDRGSVIQTLGGVVIQDFGVNVQDEIISFSDTEALTQDVVTELQSAYEQIDTEWYFTDGRSCWKVQFSRNPRGFQKFKNLLFTKHDFIRYSYSIILLVINKEL